MADSSPLGTLAAGLLLLAASLILVRAAAAFAVSRDSLAFGPTHPRVQRLIDLPEEIAARAGPVAIAIGSSQLLNGYSPELIDAELGRAGKQITSYNLGFNGFGPTTARRVMDRIAHAYAGKGTKPALIIVELTPFLTTKKSRSTGWSAEPNMQLGTPATFLEDARRDAGKALGESSYHYLLGGFSPTRFKDWTASKIYGDFAPCGTTRATGGPAIQAASDAFCARLLDHFHGRIPAWDDEARGFRKLVYPDTAESYRAMAVAMRDPDLLRRDFEWRERAVDLTNLDIDPGLVGDFVAVVKQAKALAGKVFVFAAPVNTAYVRRTSSGRENAAALASTIERETGIPVLDWTEDPAFVSDDFIDSTHLNQLTGAQKLAPRIAERLRDLL